MTSLPPLYMPSAPKSTTEQSSILNTVKSMLGLKGGKQKRNTSTSDARLTYEKMEPRQMMDGSGALDPSLVFMSHEQTPIMADVRTMVGTVTTTKNHLLNVLQIAEPDAQDDVLRLLAPNHIPHINTVYADGIATKNELSSLITAIASNTTVTLQNMRTILSDPAYLDASEFDPSSVESINRKDRNVQIQRRFTSVRSALVQAVDALQYIENRLRPLLEAMNDRVENKNFNFSKQPQGPVANATILQMDDLGRLQVMQGGDDLPQIVGDALRGSGYNSTFSSQLLDRPVFVKSITVRHIAGGGFSKLHVALGLENHYFNFDNSSTQVIPINRMIDAISLLPVSWNTDEIANINADIVIPGTGMTPEIQKLLDAKEKMTNIYDEGMAEMYSLLGTGLVGSGSVIPPTHTLQAFQAEKAAVFQSAILDVNSLGAVPTDQISDIVDHGRAINDIVKSVNLTIAEMQRLRTLANQRGEQTALDTLITQGKTTVQTLRTKVLEWQSVLQEKWAEGAANISPELYQVLRHMSNETEPHVLLDRSVTHTLEQTGSSYRRAAGTIDTSVTEGTITVTSLLGHIREPAPGASVTETSGGKLVVGGQSAVIDLTKSKGTPVKVSLNLSTTALAENDIVVTFVRGNQVLGTVTVADGLASFEDAEGITGVVIRNAADLMTPQGRELWEYRETYRPRYMNNDPGPDYFFFLEVRPEWYDQRSAIIAEANKEDVYQPTTVENLDILLDMNRNLIADELSTENSAAMSIASAPRINSVQLPNNYWAYPLQYKPNEYNTYYMRTFGGGPASIEYIGYEAPNGSFQALPSELITRIGDQWIVHPTGRTMHLAAVYQGKIFRNNTPVGYVVNGDIVQKANYSLEDAIRPDGILIDVGDFGMKTMNSGGPLGWITGAWYEQGGGSPVAMGWLKGEIRITNNGMEPVNITVNSYSGFAGTPGWDVSQGTYQITLAPGASRLLRDDIFMHVNENGGSIARFIVRNTQTGELLAEGLRSVNAPSVPYAEQVMRLNAFRDRWAESLATAQDFTQQYFALLGIAGPSMGDPATIVAGLTMNGAPPVPSVADLEHQMRQAHRILAHAIESGDPSRINYANIAYNSSLNSYIAASSQLAATPSTPIAQGTNGILTEEDGYGGSPNGILIAGLHNTFSDLYSGSVAIQNFFAGNQSLTFGNGLSNLLNQYGTEIFSFAMQYFGSKGHSAGYAESAYNWVMRNGEALMYLTSLVNPVTAAKEMLKRFADGTLNVPTDTGETVADITSLEMLSQEGSFLTAFRQHLATNEQIHVRTDSMAGRMYLWLADKLDHAMTFDEVHDVSKIAEKYTKISWGKFGILAFLPDAKMRHVALQSLLSNGQYGSAFGNPQNTPGKIIAAQTNKFPGSAPGSPDLEVYRTYATEGRPADQFVRVRVDVAVPSWANTYGHIDAYLFDRWGQRFQDSAGRPIEIKLTSQSVRDTLYVDIPLSMITAHITRDPLHSGGNGTKEGEFTLQVVAWMPNAPQGTPGTQVITQKIKVSELATPRADLSHLPEVDRDILSAIRMPITGSGWSYTIDSGFHTNSGLYALDLTAGNETDSREVFSPGDARVAWVDIKNGGVWLEVGTMTGKVFRVAMHHMDHMFETRTGITYEGLGEAMKRLGYFEQYKAELIANGKTMTRDAATYLMDKYPEVKAALQPVLDQIAVVQAAVDALRNRPVSPENPRGGLWLKDAERFAQVGNEGFSTGPHFHVDVSHDGRPISLFGWTDAYYTGIQAMNIDFVSPSNANTVKQITMTYDRDVDALTNREQGIALSRIQSGATSINEAHAIEGGAISHKIVWAFNAMSDSYMWLRVDEFNNLVHPENNKVWQWLNGAWVLTNY